METEEEWPLAEDEKRLILISPTDQVAVATAVATEGVVAMRLVRQEVELILLGEVVDINNSCPLELHPVLAMESLHA